MKKRYKVYYILTVALLANLICLLNFDYSYSIQDNALGLAEDLYDRNPNRLIAYNINTSYEEYDNACGFKGELTENTEVIDIIAPVIKGNKKTLKTTQGKEINLLKGIKVTDNSGEKINATVEGSYDFNKPGTYNLKYVAVDSKNNKTEVDFKLIVNKKQVITQPVVVNTEQEVQESTVIVPKSSNTRQNIVDIAKSQVGNIGGKPYWSWYGFTGRVEWCATFVSWVANQAGVLYSHVPKFAGVGTGVRYFKSQGQWQGRSYTPSPGDIIFFDYNYDGRTDHVGIVEKAEGGTVYTIEGNSTNQCKQRTYAVGSRSIAGYGVPNY